jgi:DNA-binding MarR family transcriptional regulator
LTKNEVLSHLDDVGDVDASELADALAVPVATASMALLRAARAGLVIRNPDPDTGIFRYSLSARGVERLAYYNNQD